MEREICMMRTVRSHMAVPVPEVYNCDSSTDNIFGATFIVMEAIHGRRMHPTNRRQLSGYIEHVHVPSSSTPAIPVFRPTASLRIIVGSALYSEAKVGL